MSDKSVKWHKLERANLEKCIKSLKECIHVGPTIPLLGIPKEAIMDINKYIPLRTLREALREDWCVSVHGVTRRRPRLSD